MAKPDDLSRSLVPFEQSSTLVAVIEMSLSSWLVAGIVPGLDRHPLKNALGVEPVELGALAVAGVGHQQQGHVVAGHVAGHDLVPGRGASCPARRRRPGPWTARRPRRSGSSCPSGRP